jgi:exodeoxyribonuclease VII small subunit
MRSPKTFEEGITRLESILAEMQSENTTLADAVKLYAEAATLVTFCNETLSKTAVQIEEIDARLAQALPEPAEESDEL